MEISKIILKCLLFDKEYVSKVGPFLKEEYFEKEDEKEIYIAISDYISKYKDLPTSDSILVHIETKTLPEHIYDKCIESLGAIFEDKNDIPKLEWSLDATENFCKHMAAYNAALTIINVIEGHDKETTREALPDIMKDAVSVSFDNNIGHDYFDSAEEQYDYYHNIEVKFLSKIDILNKITGGGIPSKTLNIFLAGINVGKTIWLVDVAADYLHKNKNVLFITLEMAENSIRQRIDANLFNIEMNNIKNLSKDQYMDKINSIHQKTTGNLVVKEFPAGSGHVGHIRHVLNELKLKKDIDIDLVCVDYLGIMASSRLKLNSVGNTNTYFSEVAKELHGLGKEFDVTVWTAHQYTRSGQNSSDVDMTDTASAIGIAATADFIIAGISNDELEEQGRLIIKQLKNRYNNKINYKKFLVGIDRAKMSYYNIDFNEQTLPNSGIPTEQHNKAAHTEKKDFNKVAMDFSESGELKEEESFLDKIV